jgi:hypothetical protein
MLMPYLPFRLDHLWRMTDDTGLMQHAVYSVPDRCRGYSVDDQARALMVLVTHARHAHQPLARAAYTYLSYLRYAATEDGGYHNFLGYDRRWLDAKGADDAHGRVLWALAHAARFAPDQGVAAAAAHLFELGRHGIGRLGFPRSWAFALFALYHRWQSTQDPALLDPVRILADRLLALYSTEASPQWQWFEPALTYCNASLPASLLLAWEMTGDHRYRDAGLETLAWLLRVLFNERGDLRLVGQNGWYPRGGVKAAFDEQCVDAQGTVEATLIALRATHDPRWQTYALAAFDWFYGRNSLGEAVLDQATWGCYDGLTPRGLNRNMGAESTVCYLLAYLDLVESGLVALDGSRRS